MKNYKKKIEKLKKKIVDRNFKRAAGKALLSSDSHRSLNSEMLKLKF